MDELAVTTPKNAIKAINEDTNSHTEPTVQTDDTCPTCGEGTVIERTGTNGLFFGCSQYPKCRHTFNHTDANRTVILELDPLARRVLRVTSKGEQYVQRTVWREFPPEDHVYERAPRLLIYRTGKPGRHTDYMDARRILDQHPNVVDVLFKAYRQGSTEPVVWSTRGQFVIDYQNETRSKWSPNQQRKEDQ